MAGALLRAQVSRGDMRVEYTVEGSDHRAPSGENLTLRIRCRKAGRLVVRQGHVKAGIAR